MEPFVPRPVGSGRMSGEEADMATKKRVGPRPRPRRSRQEAQQGLAALQEAQREGLETKQLAALPGTEYLSFADAVSATGIAKGRLGDVVKRAGVPVYRSPADARKKYIRKEDVGRLTGYTLESPGAPPGAGAGAGN